MLILYAMSNARKNYLTKCYVHASLWNVHHLRTTVDEQSMFNVLLYSHNDKCIHLHLHKKEMNT